MTWVKTCNPSYYRHHAICLNESLHVQAESEYRHALLLKRAGQSLGAHESTGDAVIEPDGPALEASQTLAQGTYCRYFKPPIKTPFELSHLMTSIRIEP